MTSVFQSWGLAYEWAWGLATIAGILLIALPLMLGVAMIIYADRKITYHHNYFKKVIKRAPAEYRGAVGHFFNNYIVGTSTTEASFLLVNTCVRVEKSVYETVKYAVYTVASGTKGNAEMIDNIATQSREFPPACTADIPYEYKSVLTNTTSDVKTVVPAGAGVGKL
jgi:pectate lyase